MMKILTRILLTFRAASLLVLVLNALCPVVFGQAPIKKLCEDLEQTAENELKPAVPRLEIDVAERHWNAKKKFAVVISAYKSADSKSDLAFAEVDGNLIARKLCEVGYTILSVLTNEKVTRNNIRLTLQKAQTITRQRNGRLLVYYSGHGVVAEDGSDLYLQVYDEPPGDKAGISIPDLIGFAYPTNAKGQLSLIIDSCFSGKGTFSGTLTAAKLKNINIISSGSGDQQPSYSITLSRDPSGEEKSASAFSYYLSQAITKETWNKVDRDSDGIITFGELRLYLATKLKCDFIHEPKKIQGLMEPDGFPRDSNEFFAFDPDGKRNFDTPVIRDLTIREIEIQSALETQWPAPDESASPINPTNCDSTFPSPQAFIPSLSHSSKSSTVADWISSETNLRVRERGSLNQHLFPWNAFLGSASIQDPLTRLASYTDSITQTVAVQNSMQSQALNPPQPTGTKRISSKALAAQLREQDGDYYTSGLKALAERRFDEARNLLQRSLVQRKVDQVRVYRSLGRNEILAGNYEAAEEWYKRALRLSADEHDPSTLNEMGNALRLGGDYDDAETLINRAISEIKEASIDFKKDDVYLTSIVNLAQLYFDKGGYKNAELLYKEALDIRWPQMGFGWIADMRSPTSAADGVAASISVAWLLRDLAGVYYSQGEHDKALRCAEQAWIIVFQLLRAQVGGGPPLPTEMMGRIIGQYIGIIVPIRNIQAAIQIQRGHFSEAENLLQSALRDLRRVFLNDDDRRIAGTLLNLAILRTKQGRIDDAKQVFTRVIAIQEKSLGPKHPDLALTLEQYSTFLNNTNQKDEAATIKARAREIEKHSRSHKSGRADFFWSRYSNPVEYGSLSIR